MSSAPAQVDRPDDLGLARHPAGEPQVVIGLAVDLLLGQTSTCHLGHTIHHIWGLVKRKNPRSGQKNDLAPAFMAKSRRQGKVVKHQWLAVLVLFRSYEGRMSGDSAKGMGQGKNPAGRPQTALIDSQPVQKYEKR